MSNPFDNRAASTAGIARDIVPIAPSDAEDLPNVAANLYVETGGTIVFLPEKLNAPQRTVIVPDFSTFPCGVRRVLATGTTATGIHAFEV